MSVPKSLYRLLAPRSYPIAAGDAAQWSDLALLWCPPAFLLQIAGRWAEGVLAEHEVELVEAAAELDMATEANREHFQRLLTGFSGILGD